MGATSELQYPVWKSIAWRFLRAGVAGGIASATALLTAGTSTPETFNKALLIAFVTGFISAAGLFIRDNFGDRDRSEGTINKLPV